MTARCLIGFWGTVDWLRTSRLTKRVQPQRLTRLVLFVCFLVLGVCAVGERFLILISSIVVGRMAKEFGWI